MFRALSIIDQRETRKSSGVLIDKIITEVVEATEVVVATNNKTLDSNPPLMLTSVIIPSE